MSWGDLRRAGVAIACRCVNCGRTPPVVPAKIMSIADDTEVKVAVSLLKCRHCGTHSIEVR